MFRLLSRIGLGVGAAIFALFIGAVLINRADPYRKVTDELIRQVAAEPQRTVRLNGYSTIAMQVRQMLHVEQAALWSVWLDYADASVLTHNMPIQSNAKLVANRADTAVHKIAAFGNNLEVIDDAALLSRDLTRLNYYDLKNGDVILADLYQRSAAVSYNLSGISQGLDDVSTAVASVTTFPFVENIQQELIVVRNDAGHVAAKNRGTAKLAPQENASNFVHLVDFVNLSIDDWQGKPAIMIAFKDQIDDDMAWLDGFEQAYREAEITNDRWHFDTLRSWPRFVADFHQPLLVTAVGSLLLAIIGWAGSLRTFVIPPLRMAPFVQFASAQQTATQPKPFLTLVWPDGRQERHVLPLDGEVVIGNVVIRRARNRYYFECIDPDAFPIFFETKPFNGARAFADENVLQVGELQIVFHQTDKGTEELIAEPAVARVHL